MYDTLPSFVLGFHGCDRSVLQKVLNGENNLTPSENSYDWLGHGIYFWENSPQRAIEYAQSLSQRTNSKIENPTCIGAVIDLGRCLNLLDAASLEIVKEGYTILRNTSNIAGTELPRNKLLNNSGDLLLRYLDCAVIQSVHTSIEERSEPPYDSVRGAFWEGSELYPDAGFKEKNHIQICVRNPNCIKGFFLPRTPSSDFYIP